MRNFSHRQTNLYEGRRGGAGAGRMAPGVPRTGMDWSTDCLREEDNLKTQIQFNT